MTAASADLTKLAKNLADAAGMPMQDAVSRTLNQKALEVQTIAASLAPRRKGILAASIRTTQISPTSISIGPTVPYGVFQEFGTASRGEFGGTSYTITPKSKKYLSFVVNGKRVYTKKVIHPGIPAHPYMRPALEKALDGLTEELASQGALMILRGPNA